MTNAEGSQLHVLLADENDLYARSLAHALARVGVNVERVRSAAEIIENVKRGNIENLILSATLPDVGPESLCRRLRTWSCTFPILVVLQEDNELEAVLCLEAGADDCVARPYRPREIFARLRAIERRNRSSIPPSPVANSVDPQTATSSPQRARQSVQVLELCRGQLMIDTSRREVWIDGTTVALTRKEFDLLVLLAVHQGLVVSRDIIAERVWNGIWSGRTIDTHVSSLRAKLHHPELIRTVRGVGFRLTA